MENDIEFDKKIKQLNEILFQNKYTFNGESKYTQKSISVNNSPGAIVNQLDDFEGNDFISKKTKTEIPTVSISPQTVKFNSWFRKLCYWIIKNICELILGVVGSIIAYFLTKGK